MGFCALADQQAYAAAGQVLVQSVGQGRSLERGISSGYRTSQLVTTTTMAVSSLSN